MEFITEYGLFFAKAATLIVAILITLAGVTAICSRGQNKSTAKLTIKNMNEKLNEQKSALIKQTAGKTELKHFLKEEKVKTKKNKKDSKNTQKSKIFVLDFNGDMKASAVKQLREEITAVLSIATPKDEVFVRIESPGGVVANYGLGASQLQRIRQKNIPLTVGIDRVAASGGYLMAAVANRILAAPFAVIGSIGVVAQLPNFNRFLKKHNVEFEQVTAGQYKRTLSLFGENTSEGREKAQAQVEEIHVLFKDFLRENRPSLNLDEVATGEYWLAKRALELKLVDDLITSDDYLISMSENHNIYEIRQHRKKSAIERFTHSVQESYRSLVVH